MQSHNRHTRANSPRPTIAHLIYSLLGLTAPNFAAERVLVPGVFHQVDPVDVRMEPVDLGPVAEGEAGHVGAPVVGQGLGRGGQHRSAGPVVQVAVLRLELKGPEAENWENRNLIQERGVHVYAKRRRKVCLNFMPS